ncbi:MAG: acyl--CoA ligase [Proteobacteria bacterium]|nr:acyl--CoA ligase [Pseudomonadota bacterium]
MTPGFDPNWLQRQPAPPGYGDAHPSLLGAASAIAHALPNNIAGQPWLLALSAPEDFAAALLALWHKGAIAVLSADTQPGTVAELGASVAGLLSDEEVPAFTGPQHALPFAAPGPAPAIRCGDYDPTATALQLFTSGTTGARRIIDKTFAQLFNEVHNLEATFGTTDLPAFTTVSHLHIYGLLFNILWPLVGRRPLPPRRSLYWEEILAAAKDQGAWITASPPHLRFLPDIAATQPFAWGASRIFSSGGPLSPEVSRRIAEVTGAAPIEIYGSTETGGIAHRQQHATDPAPFRAFAPVDIRQGADDELEARSPWLDTPHWTPTGDRAKPAGERCFFLLGRVDQIAKIAGKRVSLTEMNAVLSAVPHIASARVLQITGDDHASRASLAAVLQVSAELRDRLESHPEIRKDLTAQLRRALAQRFEPVVWPRKWRFIDAWPFDERGKLGQDALERLVRRE